MEYLSWYAHEEGNFNYFTKRGLRSTGCVDGRLALMYQCMGRSCEKHHVEQKWLMGNVVFIS